MEKSHVSKAEELALAEGWTFVEQADQDGAGWVNPDYKGYAYSTADEICDDCGLWPEAA